MAPATAAVFPHQEGTFSVESFLPYPGPARQLLRRHPRGRQRGPAVARHAGRAAGDRAGRRPADQPRRAPRCGPAGPQAADPGPLDAGGWGLHRRRPAALWRHRPGARPPGHGASTLGTFLRAFTFGHGRQLDRLAEQLLTRAWAAGVGPGDGPMTIDLDSTVRGARGPQAGRRLRLPPHPRLPSAAGQPRRHRRGAPAPASAAAGPTAPAAPQGSSTSWPPASAAPARPGELTMRADSGF
jgi:hypothetical protein